MQVEVGKIIEGKVSGITSFGAFVRFPDGKVGLVHISEIADEYVKDVSAYLKENQAVKVKVISIDEKGKISLSIKKAGEEVKKIKTKKPEEINWGKPDVKEGLSFEDQLSRFLKDSEEKMSDLKKSVESKRSGGGYKKFGDF